MKDAVLAESQRLWDLGLAIHWLHPKSKRPVESGWTTGPRKSWEDLKKTYRPGFNVGVRTGTPSKIASRYLAVVDVDVKSLKPHHREEAMAAVRELLGVGYFPIVVSGRGNGSRHYYCMTPAPFKTFNPATSEDQVKVHMPSKKPSKTELTDLSPEDIKKGIRLANAWEISLYSDGRQVVLPPSVHPDSGKLYRWKHPLKTLDDLPEMDFMDFSVRSTGEPKKGQANADDFYGADSGKGAQAGEEKGPGKGEGLAGSALEGFRVEPVDLSWLPISDDVRDAIQDGKGVTDRSGYLLKASTALLSAGLTQNEVLTVLTDPGTFLGACSYDHAKTTDRARAAAWVYRYTFKKVAGERDASAVFTRAADIPPPRVVTETELEETAAEFGEAWDWRQDLDRRGGSVKATLKSLDLIFSHAVEGTPFIEDLFASRIEYGCDTPWGGKAREYIQDIDMLLVKRWLASTEFQVEPSKDAILEATTLVAHRQRIHPVRDWLEGLKWDGVKRIDTWIRDYCQGRAKEPYLSEISRKFLLAMVKRVFDPGCQWDYVLVLEGKQGQYKSSAARALAGDKWFMDNLPDLKDKDSMLNLQGKWLIELGELADVKRADYNLVKAYLVRRTDTVRPHYGRLKSDVPRQSVFIGTINEGQYLKDPTGNRRYWPVKVGRCDSAGLAAIRDQLFAEAMHVYRTTGEVLMLGPKANAQATEAQEDRRVEDDETEMKFLLVEYLRSSKSAGFDFDRFRIRDLMTGVDAPWGPYAGKGYFMNTAAQVLANVGFVKTKIWGQRYWKITPKTARDLLLNKSGQNDETGASPGHHSAGGAPESDDEDFF